MISVIIPAKDAAETLETCLVAVFAQEGISSDFEVILVDDGSGDATADIAKPFDLCLIRQEHAGPGAARNAGVAASKGDILAFTDADCAPSPDWLARLTEPFSDPQVMGVKGVYRTHQTGLMPRFVQQEYEFKYQRLAKQTTIDFIDTYSAAYRRQIFLDNGGFDPALPAGQDAELSFRLARKGYKLIFVPQAFVYHRHGADIWTYMRRKFRYGYWRYFMTRWLPEKALSNSHTPPTMYWQILLLGVMSGILLPLSLFWPVFLWLILIAMLAFFASALPFLKYIFNQDRSVLRSAPIMLLARAGAIGMGVAYGLVSPPGARPRTHVGLSRSEHMLKRSLDIIGSSLGLILTSPLLLIASIAIKIDSRGPVIYKQERAGENGKPFDVLKLRTMIDGADQMDPQPERDPFEGMVIKIHNDPRVTRVGRHLRRWSIDEIPQFWNVLRGDMSLVGPRPEQTWVVAQYDDKQRRRLAVKPGLTGPMQVSGRAELDMQARQLLEVEYIDTYSIWKDIKLLFQTIPAVINGDGAM
jgi:lipopolysaccharide/colanic/teichoic acid biosynthesis glycosyltransferase/glycosyltransferase involved in cell wall biosynthesis